MNLPSASTRSSKGKIKWGMVGSYLFLIILAIIYLGPILMLVNTSLKTLASFMKDATSITTALNVKNFVDAWNKAN